MYDLKLLNLWRVSNSTKFRNHRSRLVVEPLQFSELAPN